MQFNNLKQITVRHSFIQILSLILSQILMEFSNFLASYNDLDLAYNQQMVDEMETLREVVQ